MTYAYDGDAQIEALKHAVTDDQVDTLRVQVDVARAGLPEGDVRRHEVSFSVTGWGSRLDRLPRHIVEQHRISRGDVFDIANQVQTDQRQVKDLFAASYLWGTGWTGYGASRYEEIIGNAGSRLEPSLLAGLAAASSDPIAGYAQFYGGDDETRAHAGEAPWSRLAGFGPAFFTKLLYFSTAGALILDNVLANAVHDLCRMPYLVAGQGRSVAWTSYRYAVYLHWMNQTAEAVGVTSDVLEYTLFTQRVQERTEPDASDAALE